MLKLFPSWHERRHASKPKQVWKIWTEGKCRRQLEKEIWIRSCQPFAHVLLFKVFMCTAAIGEWLHCKGFNIWQFHIFVFFAWEKTTVCLFMTYKYLSCFLKKPLRSSFFIFLFFFAVQSCVGRWKLSSAIDLELFEIGEDLLTPEPKQ